MANMALPMVASMLVQALYNVVDSIYVSQVSENALTAVSMAYPIQNLMIGFSTGVGVGMNSLLSKCLGSKEHDRGNRAAGNGLVLSAVCCVLFMLFGVFGAGLFLPGADGYSRNLQRRRSVFADLHPVFLRSLWGNSI